MKPVLRQSGLLDMEMCGWSYYLTHIENHTHHTTFAQLRGLAPHAAREENLRQKIETHTDLPVDDVTDAARDYVVEQFAEKEIIPDPEQTGLAKATVQSQAIDLSVKLARGDYKHYQTMIQPKAVELSLEVDIPEAPFRLGGIIDAVETSEWISDCKTSNRTPPAKTAEQSEQLSLYSILYWAHYKRRPKGMRLDYIVDLKGEAKPVQLITYPSEAREQAVLQRFMAAWEVIQAGTFMPCPSSFWKCSPVYCEHYARCKYAFAGKQ